MIASRSNRVRQNQILNLLVLAAAILAVLPGMPALADDSWKDFSSSKYHFSVRVPADLQESQKDEVSSFTVNANDCTYMVEVEDVPHEWAGQSDMLDKIFQAFLKGYEYKPPNVSDVSGSGWKGKMFTRDEDTGNKKQSIIVAVADGADYTYDLAVVGRASQDDTKTFLDSFKVTAGDSSASGTTDSSSSSSSDSSSSSTSTSSSANGIDENSEAYKTGYAIGKNLPMILLGIFLVVLVVGFLAVAVFVVVFLIKRNNSPKQ